VVNILTRLERLKQILEQYYKCEEAILTGAQEYSISGRRLRRADLPEVRRIINDLERQISLLENKRPRNQAYGVIPHDL
jgi:hypothetical protein